MERRGRHAHDVGQVGTAEYMAAGDWAPGLDVLAVNPSYFAPYAYHVFEEVDPRHDWLGLVDTGYQLLFDSSAATLGSQQSAGLPPDWLGIDTTSGQIEPLRIGSDQTTDYGFDAPRTYWRIALDLRWNGDGRAAAYLNQAGFLRDEATRSGTVRAVYTHDGSVSDDGTSVVADAGAVAALLTLNPPAANQLYAADVLGHTDTANGLADCGDPNDLYAQEWGWFATALYADSLPDVWHAP